MNDSHEDEEIRRLVTSAGGLWTSRRAAREGPGEGEGRLGPAGPGPLAPRLGEPPSSSRMGGGGCRARHRERRRPRRRDTRAGVHRRRPPRLAAQRAATNCKPSWRCPACGRSTSRSGPCLGTPRRRAPRNRCNRCTEWRTSHERSTRPHRPSRSDSRRRRRRRLERSARRGASQPCPLTCSRRAGSAGGRHPGAAPVRPRQAVDPVLVVPIRREVAPPVRDRPRHAGAPRNRDRKRGHVVRRVREAQRPSRGRGRRGPGEARGPAADRHGAPARRPTPRRGRAVVRSGRDAVLPGYLPRPGRRDANPQPALHAHPRALVACPRDRCPGVRRRDGRLPPRHPVGPPSAAGRRGSHQRPRRPGVHPDRRRGHLRPRPQGREERAGGARRCRRRRGPAAEVPVRGARHGGGDHAVRPDDGGRRVRNRHTEDAP